MPFLLICSLLGSVDPPLPHTLLPPTPHSSPSFSSCQSLSPLPLHSLQHPQYIFTNVAFSHPRTCCDLCQVNAMNRHVGVAMVTDARPRTPAVIGGGGACLQSTISHLSVRGGSLDSLKYCTLFLSEWKLKPSLTSLDLCFSN